MDWFAGTRSYRETSPPGAVVLEVSDGRRPPAEVRFDIQLQRDTEPVSLSAGTLLTGPDGLEYEVVEDGKYHAVVDDHGRETVIRLENVLVRAVEAGANSNLSPAEELAFVEDQPLLDHAVVRTGGINMGDDDESEVELRNRVSLLWAYPPAHGDRSQIVKIMEQVPGVDRAFVYPAMALGGIEGLGRVGCALVAPGRRCGVGHDSALAVEVLSKLKELGSYTSEYVMMDVDDTGQFYLDMGEGLSDEEKGLCQVDVEVQVKLEDDRFWNWQATENLVLTSMTAEGLIDVFHDTSNVEEVAGVLRSLYKGDTLHILGQQVTVESTSPSAFTIQLAAPAVDEKGYLLTSSPDIVGARIYPACPLRSEVDDAIDAVFKALGTSVSPYIDGSELWQRRFPLHNFMCPDELRLAEIVNQLMDVDGIADVRILTPTENVTAPRYLIEPSWGIGREDYYYKYTTFILSLRRFSVGPLLTTPGIDYTMGG